jgi:ABC-type sulfate transport system permease subunit
MKRFVFTILVIAFSVSEIIAGGFYINSLGYLPGSLKSLQSIRPLFHFRWLMLLQEK